MSSRLLKYLSLSIWLITITNFLFAQETTDNSTYYYNNFETAVAGNITSLGAASKGNANRISTSTTIDASTTSPLDGSVSLASIKPATNAIGAIRWNFVGNGTSGVDLTQNDWEWDFVYRNNSTSSNDDPDQMAVGNNSWRYWLYSSTYNGNKTQGFYISHVGTNLVLRYRYTNGAAANQYNTILTAALPNNQTAYIIKVQRLKNGSWAIYMDPFTAGMTTAQTIAATTTGTTGNGFTTYYYSYLETTATTSARFQWDDFNMYTRVLQFTAVGANSVSVNNITPSPLYPGQTNVIMYGLKIISRGNFNINQIAFSTTGAGFEGYFNGTGTLYKTTNPFYTIGTATSVASVTLTANAAQNYGLQDYITTSGNTDGTYSNPGYYFLVGSVNNTLNYGNPPTGTIAFTGLSVLTGNSNGNGTAGTSALNYSITGSSTGNTMTFLNAVVPPTAANVSGCGPGTYTITASGGNPAGGTYNWYAASSGGTALQSTTSTTYAPTVSSTTTYYVSYTVGGATSTRTAVTVTINPVPTSTFTATSPVNVGSNSTITYTGGDPASSTYNWNFNGGTTVSGSGRGPYTIQWSTPGNKSVTLSVTNASGCTSVVTTQTVVVQPSAPTATGGSTCGTGTVTLSASGTPAGGTYNWYAASSGGTALQSSTATTYITPSISTTTTYYVSYTSGGVESNRTAVTATVNTVPVSTFTVTSPVNVGSSSTLNFTGTSDATATYVYSLDGGTIVSGSGYGPYGVQWTTPGTKTVSITITSAAGCVSMTSQNVIVNEPPPTATGGSICGSGTVTLTASGGTPTGGTYNWYAGSSGGSALQSSTSTTYTTPVISTTTTYYVSYTSGGIESTRTAVTATINPVISSPYSGAAFSYSFSGNTNDVSGNGNNGINTGGATLTTDRFGAANSAYNFNGSSQYISSTASVNNPNVLTLSLWFNTTTGGGKLLGFGSSQTGASADYDRHIYMSNSGQLYYGIYQSSNIYVVNTTTTYNDGNWHHVVVTMGADGSTLYVDGTVQASNSSMTTGQNYAGYWRIGYDNLNSWPNQPTNSYFTGKIDDIAVYNTELSAAQIASSNNLNQIGALTTVCAGSPITFNAPTITGATYTWHDSGGGTQTGQNPTFASAVAGNYTLTVTGGPGGCSSTATINPTINPAPVFTYATPQTYSVGTAITNLSPTVSGGIPISYAVSPALPAGLSISATTGVISGTATIAAPAANYVVTATLASGCTGMATVNITVKPAAPTATGGSVCGSGAVTLTASGGNPAGGTYNWYAASSGGTALQSSTATTYTTPSISSTTTYYLSYTSSTVESSRTAVTATVNPLPVISYTTPQTYTVGTAITNLPPTVSGGTPTGYSVSPALPTGLSLSTTTGVISGTATVAAPAANYVVTATTASGCTGMATVNITVIPAAPTATGGSTCGPGTVTLTASGGSPTGGTYNWYAASSGGTALQSSTATTYTTASISTTTTYYVSYTSSGSESARTAVTATVNPVPTSTFTATSPVNVGGNSTITFTGTYVASSTYTYNLNGGTVVSGSGAGPYTVQWAIPGVKNLSLMVTNSAGCTSMSTQTVNVIPAAPTATGGSSCGAGAVTLTASGTPSGGTYNWYSSSSGGTALQSSTAASYTTASISSTTTFYVSYTSGGVESTRTAVTATINPLPVISYATPQTYLVGTAISNLPPTVSGGTPSSYAVSPALPAGLSFSATTGSISGTATVAAPATNYVVTATTASGCTGMATVNITVQPPAPTATGGSRCGTGTIALTASGGNPAGGIYNWYAASSGGTALQSSTATTYTTASISSTTTYYVSYTSSGSESTRTAVTATVNPVPVISYATPQTFIVGTAVSSLAPTVSGGTPTGYSVSPALPAGLSFSTTTGAISGIATVAAPAANYVVTATTASGCTGMATVNITVIPAAPTATGGSTCGPGTVTLTASGGNPTGGTYNWYAASSGGTALQSSTATAYTTASISTTTTYYVSYTSGGSESARTAVTATLNPVPTSTFTATSPVNVGGNSTITFTGTYVASSTYTYNLNGGTVVSGSGAGPYAVRWATPGNKTVSLMVTNSAGCTSASTQTVIVMPVAPTATGGSSCGAGTVTLTASGGSPAGGTYNWYATSTGGTALQSNTSTTYSPTVVTTATFYVSYTSGGTESTRTACTATINPIVSSPYSGAAFSYSFSGNTTDVSGNLNNGLATGSPTLTADRYGAASSAYSFNGSSQYISTTVAAVTSPTVFSISLWFNTTTAGGKLIGFGSSQTGASTTYDRHLYMSSSGQLYFGVYNGSFSTVNTTASYNDGNWHHVVITQGAAGVGTALYVDGVIQASNTSLVPTYNYTGYWRIGYDALNTSLYPTASPNPYFTGTLDDIAVYNRVLTNGEISLSNNLNQIGANGPACAGSPVTFYAPKITGATYTWTDANGTTVTGQNATFPSVAAGNYTLTVSGGPGGCSSTAIVPSPIVTASATFTATSAVLVGSNAGITYTGTEPASSTYTWNFNGGTVVSGSGQGPYQVNWSTAGSKTITLTVVSATTGCSATSTQTVTVNTNAAVYGNYAFRKTIMLNTAAAGITSTLANFPALLSIQDNDLIISGTCTDKLYIPSGPNYDFAFVDPSSATELYYQVESYNQTTGTLLVWVQIPSVSSATNNTLSFYYGSKTPPVTHNTAFFQKTWTSDYQVVYHFNEAGYTGTTLDGTANNRTATLVGFQATDYAAAGKIGSCYTFGGTSGSPTANDMEAATAPATTAFTVSAWVKMTTGGLDQKIITDQGASGNSSGGYKLGIYTNNIPETEDYGNLNRPAPFYNNPAPTPNAPTLSVGTWYYLQGVYNGSSISTYVNGVQYAVLPSTGSPFLTSTLYIGIGEGKNYPFSGLIDEPRVSNIAKSSDWLKMEYVDQNDPVSFTTISSTRYTNVANAAPIAGFLTYTWKGGSTDINSAANWDNTTAGTTSQLPAFDGTATLVIPAGLSHYPVLTTNAGLYGLNIANGAFLNLNGYTLNVGCNIYNSSNVSGGGILYNNNNSSQITWNGSVANQSYNGTTTAATGQTGNMTINNSAGGTVTITGGGLDIYNTITMVKGNLAVGTSPAALTLKSSAAQSASVAAIPTGTAITGNVTVERFVTGGTAKDPTTGRWTYRSYRLMSSPVNEGTDGSGNHPYSINYLNASTIITGTTSTYGTTPGNPSLYLYNESRTPSNATFTSGTFDGVTNISSTTAAGTISTTDPTYPTGKMYVGDGFMMYFRGDNINNLNGVPSKTKTPFVAPENVVFSTTGNLNQGTYTVTSWTGTAGLMYTTSNPGNLPVRGYNLVGNPYASSIDWSLFSNSNPGAAIYGTNVNPSIYVLNPRTSNYDVYSASTGIATGDATNVIPSGAGFYVQANNTSPTLTFKEAAKTSAQVTGNNLLMGKPNNQTAYNSYMRMKLITDTVNYDDIVIGFNSSSTIKFNPAEDSKFLNGGSAVGTLASITSDSVKASVKWLPLPKAKEQRVIPLNVTAITSGIHTLTRTDLKQLPELYEVWLMDKYRSDSLDIKHNSTYAFNLDLTDTASYGSNRFKVVIRQDPALAIHLLDFTANKASNGAQLVWKTENEQNYTNFTVERSTDNGKTFQVLGGLSSAGQGSYSFLDKNPQIAVDQYRLKIEDLDGTISYSKVIPLMYSSLSNSIAISGITIYPNPATTYVNLYILDSKTLSSSSVSYNIVVVNSTGTIVKTAVSSKPVWEYSIGGLIPGTYMIQVVNNIDKSLVGKGKFIKL